VKITDYLNKTRELKAFGAYENSVKVQASIGFLSLLKYCKLYQNLHKDSLMQPVSIHHSSPSWCICRWCNSWRHLGFIY